MIHNFSGAINLCSGARAFINRVPLLGQPAITDLGYSWVATRASGVRPITSAADDGSFPVVMVGSGNVMFGELAVALSSWLV